MKEKEEEEEEEEEEDERKKKKEKGYVNGAVSINKFRFNQAVQKFLIKKTFSSPVVYPSLSSVV